MKKRFVLSLMIGITLMFSCAHAADQYSWGDLWGAQTTGYLPFYATGRGFAASPLSTDGTDVTAGDDFTATQNIAGATYGSDKSISDAELLALDNFTGTGDYVKATTPTLVTPVLGAATGTSLDVGASTLATRSLTVDTGGVFDINLGTAAGDDFTVDTSAFVVEGDTGDASMSGDLAVTGNITAANLAGVLAYGVTWDEDDTSPTLTRTGALAGIAAASSPGNAALSIQSAMRRCVLNDAGAVVYYLCGTDSTKMEDCSTASDLTGASGQVMVDIPKFAYKYSYVAATNVHSWSISSVLLPGYEWHPAFYKDGSWVDHRYIGAYEGIGYDDSVSAYIDCGTSRADNWSGTTIDVANDKLGSVSGFAPMMDETRDEFRDIALFHPSSAQNH